MRGMGWCICILISKEFVYFWQIRTRDNVCEYVRICHLTYEKLKCICLTCKEFLTRVTNSIVTIIRVTNASTYLFHVTNSNETVTSVTNPFEFFIYLKLDICEKFMPTCIKISNWPYVNVTFERMWRIRAKSSHTCDKYEAWKNKDQQSCLLGFPMLLFFYFLPT